METTGEQLSPLRSQSTAGRLAAIRVSGADRIALLQGQLTQDVTLLTPDRALLAGWASPKGRLLCTLWLADWQDAIWLILPRERAEFIAKRLSMFVLRADVQVEVADALVEPEPIEQLPLVKGVRNQNQPDFNDISDCFYNDIEFSILVPGIAGMGIRVRPATRAEAGASSTLTHWRLLNIRAGLPIIGNATAEEFVPQMVNLDLLGAISFSKGCYVGQEIVARTQNLGRIKRRMYAFNTTIENGAAGVAPGQPVYGQEGTVGQVVDAAASATGTELLAVVRIDCLEEKLSLQPDGEQPLTSQPLPYAIG